MLTALAIIVALQCSWTWAYRGGSTGFGIPGIPHGNRFLTLMATPLAVFGALAIVQTPEGQEQWAWWGATITLFAAASSDGWGRQMDLGENDKPDNETLHWVRDLIFDAQSSFARDLTGLFMRFAQYSLSAVAAYQFWWPAGCLVASFMVATPPLWVVERLWFRGPNKPSYRLPWLPDDQYMAWVEWFVGVYLAVVTIAVILLA